MPRLSLLPTPQVLVTRLHQVVKLLLPPTKSSWPHARKLSRSRINGGQRSSMPTELTVQVRMESTLTVLYAWERVRGKELLVRAILTPQAHDLITEKGKALGWRCKYHCRGWSQSKGKSTKEEAGDYGELLPTSQEEEGQDWYKRNSDGCELSWWQGKHGRGGRGTPGKSTKVILLYR